MNNEIILFEKEKLTDAPAVSIELEDYTMNNGEKLTVERDELAGKIKRLKKFMKSDMFDTLAKNDQMIMKVQKSAMQTYKHALDLRLEWHVY